MFLSSCIYEPFGLYENPVNSNPTAPQITNLELNVNSDTLWVYGNQKLKYHFKSLNEKQDILGLKIYIDGVICDSVMSDNGEFYILQSALSEGMHKMNILLYTKSGTGSIADRLNAESILLTKKWVVMADYSKKNVTYTIENGYLKLGWDRYKNLDLKSYKIQYSGETKNDYYIDSLYYGAQRTFNITVEKTNGDIITWGSLVMAESIAKPELKISADNTYYITWHKSPYFNSIKYRYEFHNSNDNSPAYGDYGFKNGNDTVYIGNLQFSDYFNFTLYTMPKKVNESTNDYMIYPRGYMLQYAGEPTNIRSYTSYTSADTLTSFDTKNVYKYFVSGETVYSDLINQGSTFGLGHLQISPRGKFLLGKYYNPSGSGMRYFAKDLSTGKVSQMDFVDPNYTLIDNRYDKDITDNGIGVFKLSTRVFIYDFRHNIEIASRTFSSQLDNGSAFKIASDGKHYIALISLDPILLDVYKINTANLEKMYSLESGTTSWQFSPIDPNIITTIKDKTLSVIQCEPYALIRKIEFASDEAFMNIDYFTNEILTINANQFIIRSLNSGNVIKRIAKRQEQYYLYDNFILHNHHIIKNNVMLKTQ
jgi:hypothetical protein